MIMIITHVVLQRVLFATVQVALLYYLSNIAENTRSYSKLMLKMC